VVCLGPASADDVLREAIATGVTSVVRIDASTELDSRVVAVAIAEHAAGSDLVLCGDYSLDRGTGSVPAFIADELSCAQALGLIEIHTDTHAGPADGQGSGPVPMRVVRRLDGGRREVLDVTMPAVMSVEGSVARLRRASLAASLAARTAPVRVVRGPHGRLPESEVHPFRPRARSLPAPAGGSLDRVRQILDVGGGDVHAELLTLDPPAAASKILDQLRDWGYLDAPPDAASAVPSRTGDSD
jgi:electron transfer flavoprotein beta subunit